MKRLLISEYDNIIDWDESLIGEKIYIIEKSKDGDLTYAKLIGTILNKCTFKVNKILWWHVLMDNLKFINSDSRPIFHKDEVYLIDDEELVGLKI